MITDSELLRRYRETHCEAAFTELVQRYINLVYSAARRQVGGDAHLAQDVTQRVFTELAQKRLSPDTLLTGWLYTCTRFVAAKAVRAEQRWRAREEKACMQQLSPEHPAPEPD